MAKEKNTQSLVKDVSKPLSRMNDMFTSLLDVIGDASTNKRDKELSRIDGEINDVIFGEVQKLTSFTGEDISTFLVKLFNEQEGNVKYGAGVKDMGDIFDKDSGGLFSFFSDRYRNNNLLYDDLAMVCTQMYELKEALLATRDAIVTSDDMSTSISRTLKFKNNSTDNTAGISVIEDLETKFKLASRLKSHIIPNTLQYGKYYVYTIPYSKLFEQHYKKKVEKNGMKAVHETVSSEFVKEFKEENGFIDKNESPTNLKKCFDSVLENVSVYNEEHMVPIVEQSELDDFMAVKFDGQVNKAMKEKKKKKSSGIGSDGTIDVNEKDMDFSNVKDCYIKLIDPRKMIPIKIMDEIIGYYYIHESEAKVSKSPFSTTIKMSNDVNTKDAETGFLTKITDKIVKSFDKKFLEDNLKFKELILNSLMYNDIYKKELKFQFIPVDYITEFSVNNDEEGNGTSILFPSLFYAKLYLALLIFKIITIISKSNDQKIYYIKNSGLDKDVANGVQNAARAVKQRSINFTDLLNYNSMISKVGHSKDMFIPVGESGDKGIDFDIMAGQDVQLNTELMEMLRTGSINATGVPSVIMNYINEADYSRTLVMANAKFQGRVVSHQLDLNPSITELYKKLLRFSTDMDENLIESFVYALSAPKSLNAVNMTDIINNTDQIIAFLIKTMTGENSDQTADDNKMKDIMYKKLAKEMMPMLPWDTAEKLYKDAQLDLIKDKNETDKEETE